MMQQLMAWFRKTHIYAQMQEQNLSVEEEKDNSHYPIKLNHTPFMCHSAREKKV